MPLPVPPGAWGLSEEAAYAGPTETVDRQTGKPSTTQSRLRRAHGTDERYPPRVDSELVITRDRVGTIPLPRLPALLHPLECHHPLHASALRLRSHAYTTLEQYGVRWESCHVGHRAWRFDRRELDQLPIAVVMWVSREGSVSDYPVGHLKAICREVRRYAEKTFDLAMNVEIADPGTIRAPSSFPLFPTDPIVLGWSEIRPSIALLLLKSEATSMKPIRRGKEPEAIDNPQTIFISIPEHSKQDWVAIRDAIVYILDKAGLQSVAVEVSRGTSSLRAADYHGTPLPDEIWGKAPISGASVGSHGWERASSSTLGGFVEVRDVDGKWTKYGVTCYHSVLPPKPADGLPLGFTKLHHWHDNGMSLKETRECPVGVSQPSFPDYQSALRFLPHRCQVAEDEIRNIAKNWQLPNIPYSGVTLYRHRAAEQELKLCKERLAEAEQYDSFLGHVWAGSGLRTSEHHRSLDWALIEIDAKAPALNRVPTKRHLPQFAQMRYIPPSDIISGHTVITPDDVGSIVFKDGRTSGCTMGTINPIDECTFEDTIYTHPDGTPRRVISWDWCIVSSAREGVPFADVGDSGAFIVDRVGSLVGMVIAIDYGAASARFTATKDLFNDILKVTKMDRIRLPPA